MNRRYYYISYSRRRRPRCAYGPWRRGGQHRAEGRMRARGREPLFGSEAEVHRAGFTGSQQTPEHGRAWSFGMHSLRSPTCRSRDGQRAR